MNAMDDSRATKGSSLCFLPICHHQHCHGVGHDERRHPPVDENQSPPHDQAAPATQSEGPAPVPC